MSITYHCSECDSYCEYVDVQRVEKPGGMTVDALITLDQVVLEPHPPYRDPGLSAELGQIFQSTDRRFNAVYWVAHGPGRLLEEPEGDELICVLQGEALVEWHGEQARAKTGDVILWLADDPPVVVVQNQLLAFCAVYRHQS